ncbi:MAG: hypothetical protein Q7O66_11040, partial [Dehalococcoidia bacterium]|nr:hypothetical protein [Dehalococcoidia bacterium]
GDRWMISHGVYPCMAPIRWAPGSQISKDPANRDKFPPTEFYLDLLVAHHAAMKDYGLYEKLNRFLYFPFDSRGVNMGEMGIIEIAGDVGTWLSAVVPYEQNWLAQFLDSKKSPEKTQ